MMTHRFEYFDPLTGEVPDRYAFIFTEMVSRARRILAGRTSEEIRQGALAINKLTRDPGYIDPLWVAMKQEPMKVTIMGKEEEILPTTTEVEALYQNVGNIPLGDYQVLPNAQWHEVFAILALSYTEKLCHEVQRQKTWTPKDWLPQLTDEQIDVYAQDCLTLAREAITFADVLVTQAATVRHMVTAQAKKAIRKRHEEAGGPLKAAVINLYQDKYQTRSNRDAARRIFEELKQDQRLQYDEESGKVMFDGKYSLQNDDPEKRFEIWIGQAKRSK